MEQVTTHLDKLKALCALTDEGLHLRQRISAPRPEVFQAWTKPSLLAKWTGPSSGGIEEISADIRVGGNFKEVIRGAAGSHAVSGVYQDIIDNQTLTFTQEWHDSSEPETLVRVQFSDVEGATLVELRLVGAASEQQEIRMESRWKTCLENLEKMFASGDL